MRGAGHLGKTGVDLAWRSWFPSKTEGTGHSGMKRVDLEMVVMVS